ncbi:class I adenylate-forming enzyme family protein [Streptacidiphilus fuscans]|uniref:Long-chain fatty acid--CoA ligase n=1 Tax=Streptacidiphilus fuscans TaxID=2789292 RepID=A0A931B1A2_9ACTN|nr:fatty acid--CoA ligase family protein [Streptacidiphilus fuscans]MBF9069254.1 long-chain fatty acid--CoA ligase [Streptacidiphilus fuscans]
MTTAAPVRTWRSDNGLVLRDTVPARLRLQWVQRGDCPDVGLYQAFAERVRVHADRLAVRTSDVQLTYRQFDLHVLQMAAALAASGAGPGDIVGVRLPSGWRALAVDLAVAAVGAVALPWPAGQGSRESHALLELSRARFLVTEAETDSASAIDRRHGPLDHLEHVVTVDDLLRGDPEAFRPADVEPEAPARILVSSGSETAPKMTAYSHNALLGGRGTYVAAVLGLDPDDPYGETDAPSALVLAPLASSYGSLGLVALAGCGATLHLLDRFDPEGVLRAVTAWRPTHLVGVPTMLRRIADHPPVPGEELGSLRKVVSSGAQLTSAVLAAALKRFRCPVTNVYGSSDGVNCRTTWTDPQQDVSRVGTPDPRVTELRVCGPDDRPLPPGTSGEIQARGPMSPLCYVGAPELDRRYRTADGWVRTGDLGVIEADGSLRVLDRLKQVVIRGGWTISPAEVEEQVHAHPDVAEAACVAVPDPDLGERLCACLVQRPGTPPLDVASLGAYLGGERGLARRKLPELVLHLERLPLGATGKVCRRTLTAAATARHLPDPGGA